MTELSEKLAILELYEEWEAPTRNLILQQFDKESGHWQKAPSSRRSNNNDLFRDVRLPVSLDIQSLGCDKDGNMLVGNGKFSKLKKHNSKRKSKRGTILKKLRRRKSKKNVKYQETQNRVKRIMPSNSRRSSKHRRRVRKKDSCSTKDRNKVTVPSARKTEQTIFLPAGSTQQSSSSPFTDRPPAPSLHYNRVSKLPDPLNYNRDGGVKFSNKNEIPFILRVNEGHKLRNPSSIHSVIVPVLPKTPSAPQLAMQIVRSLTWDTVRRIRRSGYAEGFDIVLVKPKGMPEAPSLIAMQNSKGDLTISCDSLSNQTALSQILGLLYKPVSGRYSQ